MRKLHSLRNVPHAGQLLTMYRRQHNLWTRHIHVAKIDLIILVEIIVLSDGCLEKLWAQSKSASHVSCYVDFAAHGAALVVGAAGCEDRDVVVPELREARLEGSRCFG